MARRVAIDSDELHWCLALLLPLAMRCYLDGSEIALQRLTVLCLVLASSFFWSALINRRIWPSSVGAQLHFSMLFAILLFEPVGWAPVMFATSFGWIFAHEMFGGKPVLSPALIALATALFSFPDTGFQEKWILNVEPAFFMALACLPGGLWLAWRKQLQLPVLLGVAVGVAAVVPLFPPSVQWWEHLLIGALAVGVVFIAADQKFVPAGIVTQVLAGALIGGLVVVLRLASPDQPDGVVFALLLGSLFTPLLGRLLAWRTSHA
ncbi:MAG: RnfABCDGE type electron transport complex subunit D [Rhodospirillales bacterium]|nr:RnfABCDGE type electron transport complex subunit D [Rhodospirillales bacterium]